jgi:hypothetical protein
MKVGTFAKVCALSATAAIITAGFIAAPAAMADPSGTPAVGASTLAGYGSDTTQDVMNALATAINADHASDAAAWVASYDALGDTTIANPKGGTSGATVPRANGSGEGLKLLQTAVGHAATQNITSGTLKSAITSGAASVIAPLVDFARSSSDRGNTTNASNGVFSYVPFAKDALTLAVNPASASNGIAALGNVLTQGASGDTATTASIYSIYHCLARFVYTNSSTNAYIGVGAAASSDAGVTSTEIKPVLPAYGSGTRKYFVTTIAGYSSDSGTLISSANHNQCISDKYDATTHVGNADSTYVSANGAGINEHDGTALQGIGDGAVGPFSIPQWVAQSAAATANSAPNLAGVTDRRHSVVLLGATGSAGAQAPVVSSKANPNFPFIRTMFNVLPYKLVRNSATQQYAVFNGAADTSICSKGSVIEAMGFIKLNTTSTPASIADCGYVGNRWGAPTSVSDATTTVSTDFSQIASGDPVAVTVAGGNGSAAGGANIYSDASRTNALALGLNILEGDTDTTAVIPTTAAAGTTLSFFGNYESNSLLEAASSAVSAPAKVKVVNPYVVTLATVPGRVAINSANTIKATIAPAATNPGANVGGWATLIVNGVDVQSTYLTKRAASAASFSWKPTAAGDFDVAVEFAPDGSSPSLYGTDTTDVTVATLTTTLLVTGKTGFTGSAQNIISTGSSTVPTLTIKLAKSGAVTPTGTVKVLISTGRTGGTVIVATANVDATGNVTISLPRAGKWKTAGTAAGAARYLNIVYSGDSKFYSASTSYKVSITNL